MSEENHDQKDDENHGKFCGAGVGYNRGDAPRFLFPLIFDSLPASTPIYPFVTSIDFARDGDAIARYTIGDDGHQNWHPGIDAEFRGESERFPGPDAIAEIDRHANLYITDRDGKLVLNPDHDPTFLRDLIARFADRNQGNRQSEHGTSGASKASEPPRTQRLDRDLRTGRFRRPDAAPDRSLRSQESETVVDPNADITLPTFSKRNIIAAVVIGAFVAGIIACNTYAAQYPKETLIISAFLMTAGGILHIPLQGLLANIIPARFRKPDVANPTVPPKSDDGKDHLIGP